jgi:hypothetical protein
MWNSILESFTNIANFFAQSAYIIICCHFHSQIFVNHWLNRVEKYFIFLWEKERMRMWGRKVYSAKKNLWRVELFLYWKVSFSYCCQRHLQIRGLEKFLSLDRKVFSLFAGLKREYEKYFTCDDELNADDLGFPCRFLLSPLAQNRERLNWTKNE